LPVLRRPRTVWPGAHPSTPRRRTLDVTQPWADEPPEPGGRHRGGSRVGLIRIAAVVAAVLVTFGIAAVLVPVLLSSGPSSKPGSTAGAPPAGPSQALPTDPAPTVEPSASAAPSRTPRVNIGRYEDTVVDLVNDQREKAGCRQVRNDDRLHDAARAHSGDMAEHNRMSHTGSDHSSPQDRMREAGYRNPLAENVATGYQTPQEVMDGWMRSRDHRENILNCDAKAIGVGLAFSRDGTPYWTQDFGR